MSGVLVICTRYFGGTLLGAGGLVRAYTKSASDVLEAAEKVRLIQCNTYRCSFSYSNWSKVENILNDAGFSLDDIVYSDDVTAIICVPFDKTDKFTILIKDLTHGKTVPLPLGKKMAEASLD